MKLVQYHTSPVLRDEVDRLFDFAFPVFSRAAFGGGFTPAIDVEEDKDRFVVRAELPGLKKEEISLQVEDGSLVLEGERKAEENPEAEALVREIARGRFVRRFALPAEVRAEQVEARYENGILTVTLSKREESKPRRIEIHS
jgi:HSP20 family protein